MLLRTPMKHQVSDPTSETRGAGAGENFAGGRDAARAMGLLKTDSESDKQTQTAGSGVAEGRSGVVESTHSDPLGDEH